MKRLHQDFYIGAVIFLFSLYFFIRSTDLPEGANTFPYYIFGILGVFGLLIAFFGWRKRAHKNIEKAEDEINFKTIKLPILSFLIIVLYASLVNVLGFFVSTSIFIVLFLLFYKIKNVLVIAGTIVSINLFIYLLFVYQLNVRLPAGLLF
jgi:membrane-associated HD superfamily phosphohydrolase